METLTITTVLTALNSAGVVGILVVIFILFYRGDLMSRKTYEELTHHILEELCDKIIDKIDLVVAKLSNDRKS